MPAPAILYLSPRLRGAMNADEADALDYIDRRIGHLIRFPTLRQPVWGVPVPRKAPDGSTPPALLQ